MKTEMIEVGKIVNTRGVKGEVKVLPWADEPGFFGKLRSVAVLGENGKPDVFYNIETARVFKNCALLMLSGVDDVVAAQALKGKTLYISKTDLPELPGGSYYVRDIIGLTVATAGGEELGVVEDVFQTGAHDLYFIRKPDGSELYLPAVKEFVKEIDMARRRICVELPEGL